MRSSIASVGAVSVSAGLFLLQEPVHEIQEPGGVCSGAELGKPAEDAGERGADGDNHVRLEVNRDRVQLKDVEAEVHGFGPERGILLRGESGQVS